VTEKIVFLNFNADLNLRQNNDKIYNSQENCL